MHTDTLLRAHEADGALCEAEPESSSKIMHTMHGKDTVFRP